MTRYTMTFATALLILSTFFGCGGSTETAGPQTTGTLTFDGKPLTSGMLTFFPKGEGSSAFARINDDGTFSVSTGASTTGIAPGEYTVIVELDAVEDEEGEGSGEPAIELPLKYTSEDKTELTVTITEAGPNNLELKLTSE